jgi:glycosyltransferase involved in cell wall biosynthesis
VSDAAAHLRDSGRRIALDATTKYMDRGGSGVHTTELSAALKRLVGDTLVEVAYPWPDPPSNPRTMADRAHTIARDLWWTNLGAPRAAHGCDLLHVPVPYGPLFGRMPLVVTVHDCFVLQTPERFRRWMRLHVGATMPRLLRRADAIIAVSSSTKQDILALRGVDPDRVHVVPNGVRRQFQPIAPDDPRLAQVRARYDLPPRFILSVGQVEPRKNLARLVHAVVQAARQPDAGDLVLVHAGPQGWLSQELEQAMQSADTRARTRFIGFVPGEDLPLLYAAADALAYPSLGEGFGFPIVEAMASGTPVLTSNVSSMPEVAGDAALLVDPQSVDEIADALHRLWTDTELRTRLRTRGLARMPLYDWDVIARQTCDVYAAVLG